MEQNNIKGFLKNSKLVINSCIILITLSVVYYFFIFQPRIQKEKLELQTRIQKEKLELQTRGFQIKKEQIKKEILHKDTKNMKFDECVEYATSNYLYQWDVQCKNFQKEDECEILPSDVAASLSENLKEDELNCAELYK